MIGNPEFTRNIWLNCTWPRLLAAVVVIGVLYYATTYFGSTGAATAASGGKTLFHLIIGLWSTRRAADALAEEVGSNTWEIQRMSGLSAWSMAWGKLLGATAFPWFCALTCLALMDVSLLQQVELSQRQIAFLNLYLIVGGLIAQAISLSVALLLLRKAQLRRRLMVTFAQVCGLIVYVISYSGVLLGLSKDDHVVSWYGHTYPVMPFHVASLVVFGLWVWFGLCRLMRLELQYRNWPWAWIGFVAYAMIYTAGFTALDNEPLTTKLTAPFILGVVLTYLSFLAEPKDPVRYRWGVIALRSGDIGKALGFVPLWLITYAITVVIAVILAALLPSEPLTDLGQSWLKSLWSQIGPNPQVIVIAACLFMARDLLFLLWLNFGSVRQRADLAGLIYLIIAYFPLTAILGFTGPALLPIVVPYDAHNAIMSFAPVMAEVIALAFLVSRRWRLQVAIKPRPALAA